jgi:hypothetical protein
MLTIPQLADIKGRDARLYEALRRIVDAVNGLHRAVGVDTSGMVQAPPAIGAISVKAADGIFDVAITDNSPNPTQRGIWYFAEYDTSPAFLAPKIVFLGPSRNLRIALGNRTFYWRAYSQYFNSPASQPVAFGSPPTAVVGGGAAGPAPQPSQGSGTGGTSGGSGFGPPPSNGRAAAVPVL